MSTTITTAPAAPATPVHPQLAAARHALANQAKRGAYVTAKRLTGNTQALRCAHLASLIVAQVQANPGVNNRQVQMVLYHCAPYWAFSRLTFNKVWAQLYGGTPATAAQRPSLPIDKCNFALAGLNNKGQVVTPS